MNDLEERKAKAVQETSELIDEYSDEVKKITDDLRRAGKFRYGLDINSEAYAQLNKIFDKKIAEIFTKYDLPPGTKLKLW